MEFKQASECGENIREDICKLFLEAFGEYFTIFSKDLGKLIKAFSHIFQLEYFYVCIINNEIVGMTALVDKGNNSIRLNKMEFVKYFGLLKGTFANIVLKKYLCKAPKYPVEINNKTGSIEFVATSKKFKKMGIATFLMEGIFSLNIYEKYILEVADTNEPAYNLYQKLGYKEIVRIKPKYTKKYGINYFVYMLKE